jgi:photosystem II stability/assembly factor-like uncharacterized protein
MIAVSMLLAGVVSAAYLAPLLRSREVPVGVSQSSRPPLNTVGGESITFTFVTVSAGWAAAAVTTDRLWIFATGNGARSWHLVGTIEALPETRVTQLRFFDLQHGLVVLGTDALFAYRTADGGHHWTSMPIPDPSTLYLVFSDPSHGWAGTGSSDSGHSDLFATSDAGATWSRLPTPPVNGGEPAFRSPSEGWLGGNFESAIVYSTRDGGLTWLPHNLPTPPAPPPCASKGGCVPASRALTAGPRTGAYPGAALPILIPGGGVAVDEFPACPTPNLCPNYGEAEFVSFDLGSTWRYIPVPPSGGYNDVCFQDSSHWWVISGNQLHKTSDAGATWNLVSTRIMYESLKPTIIDSLHAWVMLQTQDDSQRGTRPNTVWELDLTSDGGLHWTQETVPVPV